MRGADSDKPSRMLREAVLYARVSSEEQEKEGFSIPSQQKAGRTYALGADLKIVREFTDVETAKKAGRTHFNEMLAYLKANAATCRVIVVEKTDRLYRNLKDYITLDELNVEVHFFKEGVVHSKASKSSEKFIHGIKVLMAKNYVDNLSEEVKKGYLEKAEEGLYPVGAPLGYQNVVGPDKKTGIAPHPEVAPFVTKLFERAATGKFSLDDLVELAAKDGLVSRRGNRLWKSQIHKVLRRRIYMGEFLWKGRLYQGSHVPLVSRSLWEQVQAVLDGRGVKKLRRVKHSFAFWGLVSCGHCGCALVGEIKKKRYVYYHCTGGKGSKHEEPYVREEVLRGEFAQALDDLHFDEEIASWLTEALRDSHADEIAYRTEAIGKLRAEIDRLQSRIETAYEDKLDGRIDAATFDRRAAVWREEQTRMRRALQEHEQANESYLEAGVRIIELSQRARALYLAQDPLEGRKLLETAVSNSTWANGELKITWRQPFDILADASAALKKKKLAGASPDELRHVVGE